MRSRKAPKAGLAMSGSLRARLGYLIAKPAFGALRDRMDVRHVNGGVFLGLNGIVIKSHGGMDAVGTAGAIDLGHAMVRNQLLGKIRDMLAPILIQEAVMQTGVTAGSAAAPGQVAAPSKPAASGPAPFEVARTQNR